MDNIELVLKVQKERIIKQRKIFSESLKENIYLYYKLYNNKLCWGYHNEIMNNTFNKDNIYLGVGEIQCRYDDCKDTLNFQPFYIYCCPYIINYDYNSIKSYEIDIKIYVIDINIYTKTHEKNFYANGYTRSFNKDYLIKIYEKHDFMRGASNCCREWIKDINNISKNVQKCSNLFESEVDEIKKEHLRLRQERFDKETEKAINITKTFNNS